MCETLEFVNRKEYARTFVALLCYVYDMYKCLRCIALAFPQTRVGRRVGNQICLAACEFKHVLAVVFM